MFLFSVKKRVFELSRVWPWRWPRRGTPYMVFIGPVFHCTIKTCLMRVWHCGYELVENEMCRFVEDMSSQTHCTCEANGQPKTTEVDKSQNTICKAMQTSPSDHTCWSPFLTCPCRSRSFSKSQKSSPVMSWPKGIHSPCKLTVQPL